MFTEAFNYLYYYNTVRKHSGINRDTPVQRLFKQEPLLDARIKYVPPLILDNLSVSLGNWSGYHLLAQHQTSVYWCLTNILTTPTRLGVDLLNRPKLTPISCRLTKHSPG